MPRECYTIPRERERTTASGKKRARIELLDVTKTITIFLVIVGHTTSNTDTIM